jgi:hypothetical protein
MWRHVDLVWTDVSEECIASIFRVEKSASEELPWAGGSNPWMLIVWYIILEDKLYQF